MNVQVLFSKVFHNLTVVSAKFVNLLEGTVLYIHNEVSQMERAHGCETRV